jgi:hypothetical protein
MNTLDPSQAPIPIRSTFVTVVAWIVIVIAGFTTLMSVMQAIFFTAVFFTGELNRDFGGGEEPFLRFVPVFMGAVLLTPATALFGGIGLLKRRNWGRLILVVLLSLGVLWNIGGLVVLAFFYPSWGPTPDDFDNVSRMITGVGAIFSIAVACLFIWVITRLTSAEVRREFEAARI